MRVRASWAAILAGLSVAGCAGNDPGPQKTGPQRTGIRLVPIGEFQQPLYVAAAPGDDRRIYVVEQEGRIRVVRDGRRVSEPFLDISSQVLAGGERGLLGLAFPDDDPQGRFYVYFTGKDARQHLLELRRRSPDRADPASARVVFVHDDPEDNHNGGQLAFGPDGLLYVGTGDGGGANDQHGPIGNAQSLASPLGKILRVDVRTSRGFRAPAGNPFVGEPGALPEIFAYGLRNPWRFSFDRQTGDLAIGDVGQDGVEEIDFVTARQAPGANFGWWAWEGRLRNFPQRVEGHIPPVITHSHSDGWCSITGGYVVRDRGVPALFGRYVYGDFCLGRIYSARLRPGSAFDVGPLELPEVPGLSSFGEDARGRVYVTSLNGPVYRLDSR